MSTYEYNCVPTTNDNGYRVLGNKGVTKEFQAAALPCRVRCIRVKNLSASKRSVFIGNQAAAPADGATHDLFFPDVNAGKSYELKPDVPVPFDKGLYVCSSSTADVKTITGTADMIIEVEIYGGK